MGNTGGIAGIVDTLRRRGGQVTFSFRSVGSEVQWDDHVDVCMHSWKLMSEFRSEIRARD